MLAVAVVFAVAVKMVSTQATHSDGAQRDPSTTECAGIHEILSTLERNAIDMKANLSQLESSNIRLLDELTNIKSTMNISSVPTPEVNCSIHAQSYSAVGSCASRPQGIRGFVELNGRGIWNAGWCSTHPNHRGVNTMLIDAFFCTASDIRRFDTYASVEASHDLVTYLQWLRDGAVVVGVTGDEPRKYLAPALRTLGVAGVHVGNVQSRGNFIFVLQKGYPEKTVFLKSVNNAQTTTLLKVKVQGSSLYDIKFTRQ